MKLDLHVHTVNSRDAFTRPSDLGSFCRQRGLDGIALTDHNSPCLERSGETIILPGTEISSSGGHIIGLGISAQMKRGLSADQTIADIHQLGGIAIIPHPYDMFRSSVRPELLNVRPDAIEVYNASSMLHSITWKKALGSARDMGLPMVAGSDSHIPQTIGTAFTIVESASSETEDIIAAIKNGLVTPVPGTIGVSHRLRKFLLQASRR